MLVRQVGSATRSSHPSAPQRPALGAVAVVLTDLSSSAKQQEEFRDHVGRAGGNHPRLRFADRGPPPILDCPRHVAFVKGIEVVTSAQHIFVFSFRFLSTSARGEACRCIKVDFGGAQLHSFQHMKHRFRVSFSEMIEHRNLSNDEFNRSTSRRRRCHAEAFRGCRRIVPPNEANISIMFPTTQPQRQTTLA